ncbi:MAG: hypothetical protein ABSH20_17695 [Tepidisphaeraceae bacterium]|jgi:hypothetical protein
MQKLVLGSLTLALALVGQAVSGEPYNPKQVPADAKWVIHVDIDAAQQSTLGKLVRDHLQGDPDFTRKSQEFETFTGTRLLDDIHAVLLFGREFEGPRSVLVIHAKLDANLLRQNLRTIKPDFGSKFHGDHEVMTWIDDNGVPIFACFHSPTATVISQSFDEMGASLDVLDGKAAGLRADSLMAAKSALGTFLFVASDRLQDLARRNKDVSPITRSADAGAITFGESDRQLFLHGMLVSSSNELARQTRMALDGLRTFVVMAANDKNKPVDARTAAIADMLRSATVDVKDRMVSVELKLNVNAILQLLPRELGGQAVETPVDAGKGN